MSEGATASRPLVSVIVLGYNGREYVEGCLSSLLDQDLPIDQYEVLYVDNGSRDGSAALVRERFPEARVVELDRNYGYAEGNNIGIRISDGGLVLESVMNNNSNVGLLAAAGSGYGQNVLSDNNGGDVNAQVSGAGSEIGVNVCGANTTCP